MTNYADWTFTAEWTVTAPLTLPEVAEDETFSEWQAKRNKPTHSQSYREGYQDAKAHLFSIERGAADDEYFAGYQAATKAEQRRAEDEMISRYEAERDEVAEQRFGWMR
jgi:hypothetical protein